MRRLAGSLAALGVFVAVPALAQSAPPPGDTARLPEWTVAAGVESLWWRDIARTGPPVLASPISWEGQGPAVYAAYDRGSGRDAGESNERSGTAFPETGTVRAIVSPPLETTYDLLAHEANHVIQHNALGPPGTSFMNEGLASAVMSERFHPGGKSFLYPWTARNAAVIPELSIRLLARRGRARVARLLRRLPSMKVHHL